ncbi:MAG: hypothetical protein JW704_13720 [Anaerolineaceae bacterium]|nr:hypothetical protein [Anaerolineaceae bacterium]
MKKQLIGLVLVVFLFGGCNLPVSQPTGSQVGIPTYETALLDAKPPRQSTEEITLPTLLITPTIPLSINTPPKAYSLAGDGEYIVVNPTSQADLHVTVRMPEHSTGNPPTLVLIPGGIADSRNLMQDASHLAQRGFVTVIFDADGRGQSGGVEDYNGNIQQDGLAAVIEFTAGLSGVDRNAIGLITFSYGITMGSGALARHPDLPVKFLIDWEGPVSRMYTTTGCGERGSAPQRIDFAPCSDEAYWSQREALNFISWINVPYQRLQSQNDHVQDNNDHAIEIVNAAVTAGLPWVRLNDYPPNQIYDIANPPAMLPDSIDKQLVILAEKYALELFALGD